MWTTLRACKQTVDAIQEATRKLYVIKIKALYHILL